MRKLMGIACSFILLWLTYSSIYTVSEGTKTLVLRLGNIVSNNGPKIPYIMPPGLHFKWPIIDRIIPFNTRIQTLAIDSSKLVIAEQKNLIVDYYVKWQINNLPLYFIRTGGNTSLANSLLSERLNAYLRAQLAQYTLMEIVTNHSASIMRTLTQFANANAKKLGIHVIAVRIKQLKIPDAQQAMLFDNMRTKRKQLAAQHRLNGKEKAQAIQANADAYATRILTTTKAQAAEICSMADSKVAKIQAAAYQQDSAFYQFYRSLKVYKKIFSTDQNTIMLLTTDSPFFKYFNFNGKDLRPGTLSSDHAQNLKP